jgi:NAD(P)-dependent dehydrogenase (short-subunit alcohol dehydrogenase family)
MAKELARHGVKSALLNRSYDKAKAVEEEITSAGGTAAAIACDVLDENSVKNARQTVMDVFGKCDILINCAGGNHPDGTTTGEIFSMEDMENPDATSFFDLTVEGYKAVFDLNFIGTFIPTQVFARDMIGRKGSCIINISSMSASRPMTRVPAYSTAKAAINNFTQWLAVHFAEAGIRVNAIEPGFYLTQQNRNLLFNSDGSPTKRSEKIIAHTPMRRFGSPDDLLGTVIWLADSNMSGFITGAIIPVDGGFMSYSGV